MKSKIVVVGLLLVLSGKLVDAQDSRMLTGRSGVNEAKVNWNSDSKVVGEGWPKPLENIAPERSRDPEQCSIGEVVELAYWRFKVIQVLDSRSMLVSLAGSTYWIEGVDTSSISDGVTVRIASPVKFLDKKDYTTAIGSKKIVKAMKLISKKEHRESIAQSFTLASGESIKLIYKSTSPKGHFFETVDGVEQTYTSKDFDEASRKLLKEILEKRKGK